MSGSSAQYAQAKGKKATVRTTSRSCPAVAGIANARAQRRDERSAGSVSSWRGGGARHQISVATTLGIAERVAPERRLDPE